MRKIVLILGLITHVFISISTAQSKYVVGDTLTVNKMTGLYSKPSNFSYTGDELEEGDPIMLLDDAEKKFYKILLLKDDNEYFIFKKTELVPFDLKQKENFEDTSLIINYEIYKQTPGNELIKFTNHYYVGSWLMIGGLGVGLWNANNSNSKELNYMSLGISAVGFILTIESYSHVKKAGIILNENGVGVKIPIK